MLPVRAAIALGSNLPSPAGDSRDTLLSAIASLASLPGSSLVAQSRLFTTAPVGPVPQGDYLNACAVVGTSLSPRELLRALLKIERAHGRDRAKEQRWGPRTLDLDLLLYADVDPASGVASPSREIAQSGLTVPHPRMHERRFVLEPLADVWPDALVPLATGPCTVRELLARLPSAT